MAKPDPFSLSPWGRPQDFEKAFWALFEAKFRPWWDEPASSDVEKYGNLYDDAKGCTDGVGEVFDAFGKALERTCNLPLSSVASHRHRRGSTLNLHPEWQLDYTLRLSPPNLPNGRMLPNGVLVVGESEWGKWGKIGPHAAEVRKDFLKLVDISAPLKIMIYGCHSPPNDHRSDVADLQEIFEGELIRANRHVLGESWMFIGISWGPGPWQPHVSVLRPAGDQIRIVRPEWLPPETPVYGEI